MLTQWLAAILDESKWLAVSMAVAFLATAVMLIRHRRSAARDRILGAMTLAFAAMISVMALGHLLAVSIKLASGTLAGPIAALYAIGIALAAPSWWLLLHVRRAFDRLHTRTALALNGWLAITLVVLGLSNIPLAAPGFLAIAYQAHTRRAVGWVLVGATIVLMTALFVGSLIFAASGQSFESFRGMQ